MKASEKEKIDLRKVFLLTIPVATAYIPLGIALGIYLTSSDIAWYWAPISAFMIFAGSIEFLTVNFIISDFSLYATAWATFIVNFRHVFYGLSFPYNSLNYRLQKWYGIWALTDETYGIINAGKGRQLNGGEVTVLQIISHIWWISGNLTGALMGLLIPSEISGFDFALTLMFIILSVDALKEHKDWKLLGYVALSAAIGIIFDRYILDNSFLAVSLISYFFCILFDFVRIGLKAQDVR